MQESNKENNTAAATAEDGSCADRTCGAEEGCSARESAASETAREENPIRDKNNMNSMTADYRLVTTIDGAKRYIGDNHDVAFDLESAPDEQYRGEDRAALDPAKAHIVGCSFSVRPGTGIYVPIALHPFYCGVSKDEFAAFMRGLMNPRITKIAHNLAFESAMLYSGFGIVIQEPVYDTICAAQMTLKGDYTFRKLGECGLKQLAYELFGEKLPTFEETTEGKHFDELDPDDKKTVGYAAADADFALRLYYKFNEWFSENNMPAHRRIVEEVESSTSVYIGIMKVNGLTLDIDLMDQYSKKAETEMTRLREEIRLIIGGVNIGKGGTTNKLKEYLFKDKNLPVVKTTEKGEPALDEEALTLLQEY